MFCGKCGSPVPDGADFCPNCGARVRNAGPLSKEVQTAGSQSQTHSQPPAQNAQNGSSTGSTGSTGTTPHNFSLTSIPEWFSVSGRMSRQEYWLRIVTLLCCSFISGIVLSLGIVLAMGCLVGSGGGNVLFIIIGLVCALAALAAGGFMIALWVCWITTIVRRLHDLNLSGWWYVPIAIAGAVLDSVLWGVASVGSWIALGCIEGNKGPNRFGEDPRGGSCV